METLGYVLVTALFSAIGFGLRRGTQVFSTVSSSLLGGAIEELLEDLVKKMFPNSGLYIPHRSQNKRELAAELSAYMATLSESELSGIATFVEKAKFKDKKLEGLCIRRKEGGFTKDDYRAFRKAIKASLKQIGDKQDFSIHLKNPKVMLDEMFCNASEAPDELIEMIAIINRHVFEIKYLGLGSDERDVVKVMQYMIEDSPSIISIKEMCGKMESFFNLINQQNNNPSFIVPRTEGGALDYSHVRELSKTDPFCFVEIKCPVCGADGCDVIRMDDHVYCKKCNKTFNIIKNEKKLEEAIKETEFKIISKIEAGGKTVSDEVRVRISELSEKMVSREYFDAYRRAFENGIDDVTAAIESERRNASLEIESALDGIKYGIEEKIESSSERIIEKIESAIDREMEKLNAKASKKLDSELGKLLRQSDANTERIIDELDDLAEEILSSVTSISGTVAENNAMLKGVKYDLRKLANYIYEKENSGMKHELYALAESENIRTIISEIKKLREIYRNDTGENDSPREIITYCSYCGRRESRFARYKNGYRCGCGLFVLNEDLNKKRVKKSGAVAEYEIKKINNAPYIIRNADVERDISLPPRINLTSSVMGGSLNNRNSIIREAPGTKLMNNERSIILVSEHNFALTVHVLDQLEVLFTEVSEIILGDGVSCVEIEKSKKWKIDNNNVIKRRN